MAFRNMRNKFFQIVLLFVVCSFFSCEDRKWEVDTSSIQVDLETQRFELDLLNMADQGLSESEIGELRKKYPQFYPLYYEGIMQFGRVNSTANTEALNYFNPHIIIFV